MKQLLLYSFILFTSLLTAQSVPMAFEDWKTTAGTQNFFYKSVTKTDASSNVYIAGATLNAAGNTDILLAKYNPNGTQLWIQQYAGAGNGDDFAADLVVTTTDVYVTGAVTTSTASPTTDAITMRYSSAGVLQWATTYNGAGNLYDAGKSIVLDASNNIYITGGSYNAAGNTDFVTLKYSPTGVQQWVSTYNYTANLDDVGIKIAAQGTYVVITGAVTNSASNYKFATLKIAQSTGSVAGSSISSAITTVSVDAIADLATDASGNIYVVGSNFVAGQGSNYYVQKMNSSLVTAWTYTYNGASSLNDVCKGIMVDASGRVYITGYSTITSQGRNIATMQLNSSGVLQWTKLYNDAYNGDDEAADLVLDASNNVYITGYNTNSLNNKDYYTIKYNSSGTKQWDVISDGVSLNDNATNIALDPSNNVIVTGQSEYSSSNFNFLTIKYVQYDYLAPADPIVENSSNAIQYFQNKNIVINTSNVLVPNIKYFTQSNKTADYILTNSISHVFSKIDTISTTLDTLERIDINFVGSNTLTNVYNLEFNNDTVNFYLPQTGNSGVSLKGAKRLFCPNLWSNIDLHYYTNEEGLKYYFVVKPNGSTGNIKLNISSNTSVSIGSSGELEIKNKLGTISYLRPIVYQTNSTGGIVTLTFTPSYSVSGSDVTFKLGSYNASLSFIILMKQAIPVASPTAIKNMSWSTYYGGSSDDVFLDVATNISNNVWVTGYTNSINFPIFNSYQGTNAGNTDAIFVKFNNLGVRQWATYFGGSKMETDYHIHGIEVDASGNCYSAFNTLSTDMPLNNSGISGAYFDPSNSAVFPHSPSDIAIVSFNNSGTLIWSTYFGGNGFVSKTYDIGLDGNNNLFVTGIDNGFPLVNPPLSYSNSFPISSGGAYFIAKFNPSHNLVWSTFFGSGETQIEKIAFTSNNDIVIVGLNNSGINLPLVNFGSGAYYNNSFNGGALDGFIAKFDGFTNALLWSTFYGGNDDERLHGLTIDNSNNIYISGESMSNSGLITGNSFGLNNTSYSGMGAYFSGPVGDGILAKFNSTNQFVSSTFLGGAANDGSFGLTNKNNVLFAPFVTAGTDLPFYGSNPSTAFVQANNIDGQDISNDGYFTAMDNNFNFKWSTYFGGTNSSSNAYLKDDKIFSNIASNDSKYYIVGGTTSNLSFPLANPLGGAYYSGTKSSSLDAFIAQFDVSILPVGIKESTKENENLSIYPNPANNFLYIKYNTTLKYSIEIIDITGRIVYASENHNTTIEKINIEHLAKGSYILKVTDKDNTSVKKLILN